NIIKRNILFTKSLKLLQQCDRLFINQDRQHKVSMRGKQGEKIKIQKMDSFMGIPCPDWIIIDLLYTLRFQNARRSFRSAISTFRIPRSEEHTSELQSRFDIVCRLLLENKKFSSNCSYCVVHNGTVMR